MKLTDFVIGKKYRKLSGDFNINIAECLEVNLISVLLRFECNNILYTVQSNPENWEAVEYTPKRGDVVLVSSGNVWHERIFLATIEGGKRPYVCVTNMDTVEFDNGKAFTTYDWRKMKEIVPDTLDILINNKSVEVSEDTKKKIMTLLGANK